MIGDWEAKIWGRTRCLIDSDKFARHELELVANSFCSFHYHTHRANKFKITAGVVAVVMVYGWRVEQFILGLNGNEFVVPSLVPHQFQVLEPGTMIEEYWADRGGAVWNGDIIRLTEGGKADWPIKNAVGVLYRSRLGDGIVAWNPRGPE